MSQRYQKLVRDLIPNHIQANGEIPVVKKLRKREYVLELKKKLVEEAMEVLEAKNKEALVEELADMQEVLAALYDAEHILCKEVTTIARKKRKKNGGFAKQLFLEDVKK